MRAVGVLLCVVLAFVCVGAVTKWEEVGTPSPFHWMEVRFALKQRNLDVLHDTLMDVSDPYSKNYGKWWTYPQILDLVAPPASIADEVVEYLNENGARRIENRRDMIKFQMKVVDIEDLFKTTMFEYEDVDGRKVIVRTKDGYIIPREIFAHVELISGLTEFPNLREQRVHDPITAPAGGIVTPEHLQSMYNIPATYAVHRDSTLCLAEFENDASFSPEDLAKFSTDMAVPNITVTKIVGPFNDTEPDLESSLDVQYGGAIGINTSVWFWTVEGWMYEFATDLQNATTAPLVVSMSWGWPEPLQCEIDPDNCQGHMDPTTYLNRVNTEFQKIGLAGTTLVASSGDQGSPGDGNPNCDDPKKPNMTDPLSTIYPGASPYVLSVGATMLVTSLEDEVEANPPICNKYKCATSTTEAVCTYPGALITTGGGFSNYSPRPSFQASAVNTYLSSGIALPPTGDFNKSNRGYPDVSALGHNYLVRGGGQYQQVDGTSCSSPVVAGIFALLNSYRLNNGKSPLGYVVPLVYAAYAADATTFTDITTGNNKCTEFCCAKIGYVATKGWDPVTGLGTPQFPQLLKYVQSLS